MKNYENGKKGKNEGLSLKRGVVPNLLYTKKPTCMILGTYMHEDKAECRAPRKGLRVQVQNFCFYY